MGKSGIMIFEMNLSSADERISRDLESILFGESAGNARVIYCKWGKCFTLNITTNLRLINSLSESHVSISGT